MIEFFGLVQAEVLSNRLDRVQAGRFSGDLSEHMTMMTPFFDWTIGAQTNFLTSIE